MPNSLERLNKGKASKILLLFNKMGGGQQLKDWKKKYLDCFSVYFKFFPHFKVLWSLTQHIMSMIISRKAACI